jgi:CRP-like cAMP-binding protein
MEIQIDMLRNTEFFDEVADDVIEEVIRAATPLALQAGEWLLSPEAPNNHMYLILDGTFSVHLGSPDSPALHNLHPGVSVGEISVVMQSLPSAYVIANEEAWVLPIGKDLVWKFINNGNRIPGNLLKMLFKWLLANGQAIISSRKELDALSARANTDSLTGLYNRNWLDSIF